MPKNHRQQRPLYFFMLVPAVVWSGWLALMANGGHWGLFADNWFMTVTMCIGSFIAGATSEGGGAVAFPVMTLLFDIRPSVARDFSLIIQSVGMTSASVLIILLGIQIERRAVLFAGVGGGFGVVLGLELIQLPSAYAKMFFTSLWLSFAFALWWLNRRRDRFVTDRIDPFCCRQAIMLTAVGIAGGIITSITGSGLDILTFTLLTLYFRISEKIATPTSVVLMASNALVGAIYCGLQGRLAVEAVHYWYVCVPVVVVGAPIGAYFIHRRTRQFIARLVCLSIVVQFFGALWIVPNWRNPSPGLLVFSVTTLTIGIALFARMAAVGGKNHSED